MKKAIAVLTSIVLSMSLLALPVTAVQNEEPSFGDGEILLGDADLDGVVTAGDARIALRASVDLENLTEQQFRCADFTQDGKVTADDARMILRTSVGLEGDVTPPTDSEDPSVPVEPDPPTQHSHSYVNFACECGEVQDGHFNDFLKGWILDNYTSIVSAEYQVEILATYEDGSECAAVYAYETQEDALVVATVLIAYDYIWVSAYSLPDGETPCIGVIEALDSETGESVGNGRFELAHETYMADEPISLFEFNGYSGYRSYYEEMAGISLTAGVQILHNHLHEADGYLFSFADMGFPLLFSATK